MTGQQPAGLGRRLAARALDGSIGAVLWSLSAMWLVILTWAMRRSPLELEDALVLALAVAGLAAALHLVYHVCFIGGCGQTPGKMALGVAVVRRDGRAVGYWRAALRCVGGALSALTFGLASLGLLWSRERRGLGDVLAGTRVVRLR